MSNSFNKIVISEIVEETQKAKSFVLEIPENLREDYRFKAGQYLTLRFEIEGEEERRSYSLSSSPTDNKWRICVKRVDGGKISNYMCDNLNVGDKIDVMPPDGRFTYVADPEKQGQYYLFAAGSGITPVMSIAREILEQEPLSTVYLLYGNIDEAQVIYQSELEQMVTTYGDQFHIRHAYSSKEEKRGLIGSLFKKSSVQLPYFPGRIAQDTIKKLLGQFPVTNHQLAEAYICGPGSMNSDVQERLIKHAFVKSNIHFESFGTTDDGTETTDVGDFKGTSDLTVELDGETIKLKIDAQQSILDCLIDEGYDPPHSCCSGACSSCMAKMKTGKVHMEVAHALDDDDIADGYILTCQAHADAAEIHIVYE